MGGSFDPIHNGHIQMAQDALEKIALDEVWFLPARQAPLRDHAHYASFEDRCQMVQLAISGCNAFHLCAIEKELPTPSYTIHTIEALKKENPAAQFFWILGQDQVEQLPSWHRIADLANELTFVAFLRAGYASHVTHLPDTFNIIHLESKVLPASSSLIREKLASGSVPAAWLPDKVCQYLANHALYQ